MAQTATASCPPKSGRKDGYARRRPEETALYQCVAEYWPEFRERMAEHGGLPSFVEEEFDSYLRCGRLEAGCLELECRNCGHSMLVAFSCKRRGFCAACLGRRMSDTAVHLVQEVLPKEPIRHWVCSFPWGVRSVLGYDKELCRDAAAAFAKELSRSLKRRAKALLGLARMADALTGSICVVQRTDGALRLNVHLHVLALDGVYTEDAEGVLTFHPLPTPTAGEVAEIAERTAKRLHKAFQTQGRVSPWGDAADAIDAEVTDSLQAAQPGLFACYQAAAAGIAVSGERAGQPLMRLMLSPSAMTAKPFSSEAPEQPIATALGVNIYAKQLVDGRDRAQLERLCRYVMRPPLSQERLEWRSDGRLLLTLKNVWKDGTHALTLAPHDLLVRLCAAIPLPWFNRVRHFGVFLGHSKHRSRVVPADGEAEPGRFTPEPASGDQLELVLDTEGDDTPPPPRRSRWGWLLRHVFRADVETCDKCGGPMRWVRAARDPPDIAELLTKHGLQPEPSPQRPPVPLGQMTLPLG